MEIRKPAVAGTFYPDNKSELQEVINTHLNENQTNFSADNIFGIVAPHAGYVYSGGTAASVYNLLKEKSYSTVIVISPSHRTFFHGISIYQGDAYKTPLGIIEVDKELREKISQSDSEIEISDLGHGKEHALEVQLPFLQTTLPEFKLLPIVIGDQSGAHVYNLAKKLSEFHSKDILIVASSDLSHFYTREKADKIDGIIERHINNFDFEQLQADLEIRKCEACGGGGIVALMKTAKECGYNKSKVLQHTDSGDINGDTNEVVGYLSAVIYD